LIKFETHGRQFRILILMNVAKQIYRASLAVDNGGDLAMICQHEYHATEPGWHCHLTPAQLDSIPAGFSRKHLRRWPQPDAKHSKMDFDVDEKSALSVAAARFRFAATGTLL
jgi:hypothetical protein